MEPSITSNTSDIENDNAMLEMNPETLAIPLISDLVLIGGGHAHVHVIKMFGMNRQSLLKNGIQVTLIAGRDVLTPYSGMLPGMVAGHYSRQEMHLDLRRLCSFSGVRLIHASARSISYDRNGVNDGNGGQSGLVHCDDGRPPIRFDVLSINVGSAPSLPEDFCGKGQNNDTYDRDIDASTKIMDAAAVTPVKPISGFSNRWKCVVERLSNDIKTSSGGPCYTYENPFILVVVGGGAGE